MDSESDPSPRLVEQRIRNRIIEYFELASSFDAQREWDRNTIAFVPHEVINLWEDWNPLDESVWPNRLPGPYSDDEIEAMRTFQAEWDWVADHTPDPMPRLEELQQLPAWGRLRAAAGVALKVFKVRGPLPENREV